MLPLRHSSLIFRRDFSRLVLGIRREDPARIWERRSPLTPEAVHNLINTSNVDVLIQDCERRAFKTADFVAAGARVHDTLQPAHIILGIKETPINELLTSPVQSIPRTYLMFSHTVKGQSYNMGLLSNFLTSPSIPDPHLLPRLIDYELLTENGKRSVAFGWFAGVAGALETLSALSQALLDQGIASPFLYTPRPHTLPDLPTIRKSFHAVGQSIAQYGTPKSLGPFVIGVTGAGNVTTGVLSILSELPIEIVRVEDLPNLVTDPTPNLHKIYLVQARAADYFFRSSDGGFDRNDYFANPHLYQSSFHTIVAPYLTTLINAVGWTSKFPRSMTNAQLPIALEQAQRVGMLHGNHRARFISVGDISCDVEGGLEFLTHSTTLSQPFFTARPPTIPPHLPGVQMMAVDILPAALPLDASTHFSNVLVPYLESLIEDYQGVKGTNPQAANLREALDRATIAKEGKLVGNHQWLAERVSRWSSVNPSIPAQPSAGALRKKRVLMFGSGMVAGPAVDEICRRKDIQLVVGSNLLAEAEKLARKHDNAIPMFVDMNDSAKVESLIKESDIVISLLPASLHHTVAETCIKQQKHMITASYISPEMKRLHSAAINSDVLLLNEIGLDPGIDHCSAISLLDQLRSQGKIVVSFTSFCGGLPAPESAEKVPLGYKFSWSPRGVLSAALNGARFKLGGKDWEIPGEQILRSKFPHVPISNVLNFEGIANRNSLPYADTYELGDPANLRTILRGTLRYPGFCDLMHSFKAIGLLDTVNKIHLDSWSSLLPKILENKLQIPIKPGDHTSLSSALNDVLPPSSDTETVQQALSFLSLSPSPSLPSDLPPIPQTTASALEHFATLLAHKLRYEQHERDLVILSHEIISRDHDSQQEQVHTSSLIAYGSPSASAMSRTVGLPVAFAALKVLDGEVGARGVHGPGVEKSIWSGVLSGLDTVGLGMKESVKRRGVSATVEGTLVEDFNSLH